MDLKFTNTASAIEDAETLLSEANTFGSIVASLDWISKQLAANWEGDSADITSIQEQLNSVSTYCNDVVIQAMTLLGNGVKAFAEAVESVSEQVAENGGGVGGFVKTVTGIAAGGAATTVGVAGDAGDSVASGTSNSSYTPDERKWGEWNTFDGNYWNSVGQDFAENWDYSDCNSGLDYITTTVGGIATTALDAVETGFEVVGDFLSSGFSAVGNAVDSFINWLF